MNEGVDIRKKIIRRVHLLAKKIWGTQKIGGVPAYIFWTRVWAKIVYGVERRRDLPLNGWLNMLDWLEKLRREVFADGSVSSDKDRQHIF